jgi:hypothetical protein
MTKVQYAQPTMKGITILHPNLHANKHIVKLSQLVDVKSRMIDAAAGCEFNVGLQLSQSFEYLNAAIEAQERLAK